MELHKIACARSGFTQKFGIPRQSRTDSALLTRIVFEPKYRVREALRGIDGFSHLWLIWGFSQNEPAADWSPTVRPPRLGGNTRMGVFATRSPFRPNALGLTSVELVQVEETPEEGLTLLVRGADLLDGTPIYDIKPYLSFTDAHSNAKNGFAEPPKDYHLPVEWTPEAETEMRACEIENPTKNLKRAFEEILSQDPRPAYQDDPERLYGLEFDGFEAHFRVVQNKVLVTDVRKK